LETEPPLALGVTLVHALVLELYVYATAQSMLVKYALPVTLAELACARSITDTRFQPASIAMVGSVAAEPTLGSESRASTGSEEVVLIQ